MLTLYEGERKDTCTDQESEAGYAIVNVEQVAPSSAIVTNRL